VSSMFLAGGCGWCLVSSMFLAGGCGWCLVSSMFLAGGFRDTRLGDADERLVVECEFVERVFVEHVFVECTGVVSPTCLAGCMCTGSLDVLLCGPFRGFGLCEGIGPGCGAGMANAL
jgi:hypothetical protein